MSQPRPWSTLAARRSISLVFSALLIGACRSPELSTATTRPASDSTSPVTRKYGALVFRGLEAFRVASDSNHRVAADNTGRYGRGWSKCTNLGLDLLTVLVAERVELGSETDAAKRVSEVLYTLESLRKYHGIFPEFIKLDGEPRAEIKDGTIRYSTIDSAWVTVALSFVDARYRSAHPSLAGRARALIEAQEYTAFVVDDLLSGGASVDAVSGRPETSARFTYGDRNSEARPLLLALIGLGLLPPRAWEHTRYAWTMRAGVPLAAGYHMSAFVELSGQLFFDEMALAPRSLGVSHRNYVEASAQTARAHNHAIWGYAPSCEPPHGYAEFGLDRPDVVTPYAAAELATTGVPIAEQNLSRVLDALDWQGGPVADALDPVTRRAVCTDARMLDQSLLFLALHVNALRDLARATSWYASAEARLRDMERTHLPPRGPTRVPSDPLANLEGE